MVKKESDDNHQFAFSTEHGRDIHISEATKRGRQGYKCISCKRDMQAALPRVHGIQPYFRHDPKNVKQGERCTFKDEEYRKALAITTLELEKRIKVPALYKFPPKGVEGLAIPIFGAEIILAEKVKKNISFYEDNQGELQSTSAWHPDLGNLLFKADVVFYNEEGEPMLFIQIVKKYGLSSEHFAALKRIRVNTIQITIPKDSPENIFKALMNGSRAKWIYNDDEQQLSYFSIPSDAGIGISAIDSDQRKLLEESFDCRKVQINNLIRAINRCLASEPYQSAERELKSAIGKAFEDIRSAERQRDLYEEQYRAAVQTEYSSELGRIADRRAEIARRREDVERIRRSLEGRYLEKRRVLEKETRLLESEIRRQDQEAGRTGETFAELRRKLDGSYLNDIEVLEQRFGRELFSFEEESGRITDGIVAEKDSLEDLEQNILGASKRIETLLLRERDKFDKFERDEKSGIEKIRKEQDELPDRFRAEENSLTAKFERLRGQADDAIKRVDAEGTSNISKRIEGLFSGRRYLVAIEDAQFNQSRYRRLKEFLQSPAFKKWLSEHKLR